MSDLGTIALDKHRLRLADQATFAMRGTWIVHSMQKTVIPAWRIEREKRAERMQGSCCDRVPVPTDTATRGITT